jgi:4-amino-4-deoxy-L-arabinose transferase-like glycosyltransferase
LPKRDLVLLVVLALLAITMMFWRLGEGSLSDFDEADYAQSAREMLWLHDFNTPRWNGMEFFDKPPLVQWLTAMAYKVFGVNEFGARFVAACCGVLTILLTYVLGRDLFHSRAVGTGAAIMLLTASGSLFSHGYNFVSLARVGMLDMPLILALMFSVWLAWRAQWDAKYLVWLGIPLGLGLMIKSIAGFFAFGIVALYLLVALPRSVWWRKETLWGGVLSLVIAAPWHIGQLLIWGQHFWNSYMVSLTVGYVTGEQGHTRDWLFYFRSIQRGFPVLYPVVALAVVYGLYQALRHRDKAAILLLCWTAVPMLLYNVSRSRIGWYMIPIYPALALLTSRLLVKVLRSKPAILVIFLATFALGPWLPRVGDFNPDVKKVASYSQYVLNEDAILVNYWPGSYWIRPSALFYAGRPLLLVTDEQALRRLVTTRGDFYILVDRLHWEPVQELGEVIYRSGDYLLARAHGALAEQSSSLSRKRDCL